ncbi:MAG: Cgl0159 family (beta/alpha)8-fold protein, partial [Chloroflexota bacterium]
MNGGPPPFSLDRFFPRALADRLTEVRVSRPEAVREHALRRRRRPSPALDGRMAVLAADHPARMVTRVLGRPFGMGNRIEYLGRAARALIGSGLDGFMATPDLVDDMLILDMLVVEAGAPSFLDDKLLVGCVNRGGLAGGAWEMDDRATAYTPDGLVAGGLDGAKLMFRVDLTDPRTADTLSTCARTIDACAERGLLTFLEPLPITRQPNGDYSPSKSTDELVRLLGVASALGT